MLLVKNILCSKFHCQKGFDLFFHAHSLESDSEDSWQAGSSAELSIWVGHRGPRLRGRNPHPYTLNLQPYILNPQPYTLNPQPSTLHPQPSTHTLNLDL